MLGVNTIVKLWSFVSIALKLYRPDMHTLSDC